MASLGAAQEPVSPELRPKEGDRHKSNLARNGPHHLGFMVTLRVFNLSSKSWVNWAGKGGRG